MKLWFLLLCLLASFSAGARKHSTGPARVSVPPRVETPCDTIFPSGTQVRLSGYDKPNSATRESFFATNAHPDSVHITELGIIFTYYDMQGRQLHEQQRKVPCSLPPGATRQLTVPSWDRNNAFHYHLSQPPLRRQSTRYRVSSRVIYALVTSGDKSGSR